MFILGKEKACHEGTVPKWGLLILLGICLLAASCKKDSPSGEGDAGNVTIMKEAGDSCGGNIFSQWPSDQRSRLFWVGSSCGENVLAIRSIVGRDTLQRLFVLRDSAKMASGQDLPQGLTGAMILETPLKRVAVLSSAQIGYLLRLGLEDRIVAVGESKYIADSSLFENARAGVVAQVGNGTSLDLEKLMLLKPDLVMTFATGGSQDDYDRLEKLFIPVMLTSEWQETSLGGKADWVRVFGALFGVDAVPEKLDDLPEDPCKDLDTLQDMPLKKGPRVLAGMSYGGVWYAPGGKSYTADLIRKAGGCYLWAADSSRELRLAIEDVIALSDSVDLWVNPGMFSTPEELLAAEPRVAHIKAFKEKQVFQNDGVKGPLGGNDFFEGAVARPQEVVRNLRALFEKSKPGLSYPDSQDLPRFENATPKWYHNIF